MTGWSVHRLEWTDEEFGSIAMPERPMPIRSGFGSGLSRRRGDPPGIIWAISDRGPNFKISTAVDYGLERLKVVEPGTGAKIMPRLDIGPSIAKLRVSDDRVERVETIRIAAPDGTPVSGLPIPSSGHASCEPALDLDGNRIDPDPAGLDSEGLTALADGGFWISEEYGPSLLRLDERGRVLRRLMPEGIELTGAPYPVDQCLPAIAKARKLNRGFEAMTLSPDEKRLFVAFQSPLAHPDEEAHEQGRHVRIWRLDAVSGEAEAQFLYPLDPPESFRRDKAKGDFKRSDIKVSEMCWTSAGTLIVLERGSETTRLYSVSLTEDRALPPAHFDLATRPTVEELSPRDMTLPLLDKQLLFDSDEAPEVSADLEGMAILSPTDLIVVSDNDFGVEGAQTRFWRIRFDEPILGAEQEKHNF